jgi:capsular exopolysaccharide synthesis family protein
LRRYLPSFKQYSWIVLVCTVLALVAGFGLAKSQPQAYIVSSTLDVNAAAPGTTFQGATASATDSITQASDDAAQIPTRLIMGYIYDHNPAIKAHGFQPDDLLYDVTAIVPSPTASTISITATTAHAEDTVLLANAVANGFKAFKDQELQQHLKDTRASLQAQYDNYQAQSNALEAKILSYPQTDPHVVVYTQDRTALTSAMNAVQTQLLQLPPTVQSDVFILQTAKLTDVQSSSKSTILISVSAAIGLILGLLLLLLMVFLDDRLRGDDQVTEKLGMTYLGGLSTSPDIKGGSIPTTGVAAQQLTDIGANLQLTEVLPGPWRVPQGTALLVTSPQSAEGKTTVAAGLAASVARSGRSVLVIDGNLRKPGTHLAFGMSAASFGLSGLLKAAPGTENLDAAVQRTNTPGVWLMPVGAAAEDTTLLLAQKLTGILAQLTKKTDFIIIDGPAVLEGAEASLLASMADGVALVVDNRHDKLALLLRTKDVLRSVTEKPIGVIINRLLQRKRNPYYTAAVIPDVNADKEVTPHTHASNGHNGNGNGPNAEQVMAAPIAPIALAPIAPVSNPSSLSGYAVPASPNRGTTSLMDFSTMQPNPNPPLPFPSPREKR